MARLVESGIIIQKWLGQADCTKLVIDADFSFSTEAEFIRSFGSADCCRSYRISYHLRCLESSSSCYLSYLRQNNGFVAGNLISLDRITGFGNYFSTKGQYFSCRSLSLDGIMPVVMVRHTPNRWVKLRTRELVFEHT